MTDARDARARRSGAVAGLCPTTEANLGDGIFQRRAFFAPAALRHRQRFQRRIGVAEELSQLEYGQRLARRERNALGGAGGSAGARPLRARRGGRRAGARARRGRPGGWRPADIVSLDLGALPARPRANPRAWIFTNARAVDCVWSGGVEQVCGGRHRAREPVAARFARRSNSWRAHERAGPAASAHPHRDLGAHPFRRMAPRPSHPFEHELTAQYRCSRMTVTRR